MAKDDLSGKLAVILHADVAGSTQLVQQDEQLAHERIRDTFRRFSDTIGNYHGRWIRPNDAGSHMEWTATSLRRVTIHPFGSVPTQGR